jgi:hypothetical protein
LSVAFDALNPLNLYGTLQQFIRPVLLSVTVSSVVITGIVYLVYSLGYLENFPRSVLLIDWLLTLILSLLIRLLFRYFNFYKQIPVPA